MRDFEFHLKQTYIKTKKEKWKKQNFSVEVNN
jgi:hypothetical protein